ncbi:MAG: hypothetical protein IJ088_02485 [Clostridia bacterium]|nr:hypothetical protein [Clostridia bacterium]
MTIEERIIRYLDTVLAVPVYAERPNSPDAEYIIVERTGGGTRNYVRTATVAIQSHADSLYRASSLCETVVTAMESITELENISRCEHDGSYNYTDTDSKKYRYQAVFNLVYMDYEEGE